MIRIEHILSEFQKYSNNQIDCGPIQKAYVLAAKIQGPSKFFRTSYLEIALEVAKVLTENRLDIQTIVSGILHGILLEDKITVQEIRDLMGSETAAIVESITKIIRVSTDTSAGKRMAESMRQMIFASQVDIRIIFVNLAVRLVQLRNWKRFFSSKDFSIAQETLDTYGPIADRLGLSHIKIELEDVSFWMLYPKKYREIEEFCQKNAEYHQNILDRTTKAITDKLSVDHVSVDVRGRIKHYYSIFRKAERYNVGFDKIHDLIGIRIITKNIGECYKVLGLINELYQPLAERFKDYISFPKPNGYQSLHTMVFDSEGIGFEIQIRTEEMDRVAELGVAAHWAYKADSLIKPEEIENTAWLMDLTKDLNVTTDPKESLEIFTRELFSDFVYAFTPKGKIFKLPVGASVIDFAYEIHSQVGHNCVGALINGKHSSIKTVLKQGDTVEILTQKDHNPSIDWLKFAVTSRALSQIRQVLRKKEKQEAHDLGKEIFSEEMVKLRLKYKEVVHSEKLRAFMEKFNYSSLDEYFSQLGFGKATINNLGSHLVDKLPPQPLRLQDKITKTFSKKRDGVRIAGIENIMVSYANCCNPVKGDKIVGVVTRGQGVSIHMKDCENILLREINPERLVEVEWIKSSSEKLPVRIHLEFDNQIKTNLQIMKTLVSGKAELLENNLRVVKDKSYQDILIKIDDLDQLEWVLKRFNALSSVKAYRKKEVNTPN
ncbi:MAG: RelA/SpoT family protein [Deltaproteobacteria bacterium]|nr:RelA/SpoT family protein [Deltaproteobacteria bacterium]